MTHPYTVALLDAEGLPADARIAAEIRYATALERSLGGAQEVLQTLQAWTSAHEAASSDLDRPTIEKAMRWPRAADLAQQAAFRSLGEFPGAHFEVRPVRS